MGNNSSIKDRKEEEKEKKPKVTTDAILKAGGEFTFYQAFWKKLRNTLLGLVSLDKIVSQLDDIKNLVEQITELDWYQIKEYDLTDARNEERVYDFPIAQEKFCRGNILIPITLDGTAQVRFDSPTAPSFELSEYEPLKLRFYEFYLTNAPQPGKMLQLLVGKGNWELDKRRREVAASTTTALGAGRPYTSAAFDAFNYARITLLTFSDQASAANGVQIQQSIDGTNWDYTTQFSAVAATGLAASVELVARYVRIVYTNGAVAQTTFRLTALVRSMP